MIAFSRTDSARAPERVILTKSLESVSSDARAGLSAAAFFEGSWVINNRALLAKLSVLVLAAASLLACGADKNRAERQRLADQLDAGAGCLRTCNQDLGSLPTRCADAEKGLEFLVPAIWSFDDANKGSGTTYEYDDGSAEKPVFGQMDMQRCQDPNALAGNKVFHVRGGPFMAWGGGIGTSMKDWWKDQPSGQNGRFCTGPGDSGPCVNTHLDPGIGANARGVLKAITVDVSTWDGVSFWGRRGPDGQAGLRASVGDKYTDEDLNIDQDEGEPNGDEVNTEQRYCRRMKRCDCSAGKACSRANGDYTDRTGMLVHTENEYYCWNPAFEPAPPKNPRVDGQSTYGQSWQCGQTACDAPYPAGGPAGGQDPAFNGKPCTPYQTRNGSTFSYCYRPGVDPNPPEPYEQCGDHWQTPVRLTEDWQLFLVPFSGMRQQGWAKESPGLLTNQISMFRFTWEQGYVDFYIDDVRFYRVKR